MSIKSIFTPVLLFFVFFAAIVAVTWPWAATWATHVLDHWDPPFHAWKLEYAARQLLAGRILPADGNTNMYYPYSGAFYFEALHWPQAVFAAPLLACGMGPVLTYHITLVSFWALSGVCFWMMLRALGFRNFTAAVGGLLFVLIPYRISYMEEFNMQLNFALPLFFCFFIRFFERGQNEKRKYFYAIGMGLAWWLQAVSELYQAIYLLFVMPFFACAALSGRWRLLRDWRLFWLPLATAATLCGALSLYFLWSYFTTLQSNTLTRGLAEIRTHILEPFTYLRSFNRCFDFMMFDAKPGEMYVYPTLSVMFLAAAGLGAKLTGWKGWPKRTRLALCALLPFVLPFALISAGLYHFPETTQSVPRVGTLYKYLPLATCALLFPALVWRPAREDARPPFIHGFFAAALFAFFMSLGPVLSCRKAAYAVDNGLFMLLYNHIDALRGFRVVSRFSIFVMLAVIIAACYGVEWILNKIKLHRGRREDTENTEGNKSWSLCSLCLLFSLCVTIFAFFIYEVIPQKIKTIPLAVPPESKVLGALGARAEPFVLAMLPMGNRRIDSQLMLQAARYDKLSVWAWGGAYPEYTKVAGKFFSQRHEYPAKTGADHLRQLWPEALLLEDKNFSRHERHGRDYSVKFAGEARVVDEDGRYVLMALKPDETPKAEWVKLIRHDYAMANPMVEFETAGLPDGNERKTLYIDCNGVVIAFFFWDAEIPAAYRFPIQRELITQNTPVRLRVRFDDDAEFVLRDFKMRPLEPDEAIIKRYESLILLPWLSRVWEIPATAQNISATYSNGLKIAGAEVLETDFTPGGKIRVRYYLDIPTRISSVTKTVLKTGITKDDKVLFEHGDILSAGIDMNWFWTGMRNGLYVYEHEFVAPDLCEPGIEYGLSLTVRDKSGKRLTGREDGGAATKRVIITLPK